MEGNSTNKSNRERAFRFLFLFYDQLKYIRTWLNDLCGFIFLVTTILFLFGFLTFVGFSVNEHIRENLMVAFRHILVILALSKFIPEFLNLQFRGFLSAIFRTALLITVFVVLWMVFFRIKEGVKYSGGFTGNGMVIGTVFMLIVSESSRFSNFISNVRIPPAMIFSGSFLIIIITGSGLLMLPNAHNGEIAYFDALFTSVSAVCVTGLTVLDTSTVFSKMGQIIILCLIQIGGLGIMTFTGFFSYIFTSGSSFQERLILKDLLSSDSLNNLFRVLIKIILFTFLIELAGAGLIYLSVSGNVPDTLFFSVFHSVSAFCNAGFSTLPAGLTTELVRSNLNMHSTIAGLIILGGIGFPVLLKLYSLVKHFLKSLINNLQAKRRPVLLDRMDIGSRLVLRTTIFLLFSGTILYYALETDYSNKGLDSGISLFNSFFNSVTARTAGFNVIDLTSLGYPSLFLTILLMWIGASPGSTGGGIKTSTFSIAMRAAWSVIRGKTELDIFNREISNATISRVLAIIMFSLLAIGLAFFVLLMTETGKDPVHLLYEIVSAYSTVGLSVAGTSTFSQEGRVVLIILMFTGRVGLITLLMAFFKSGVKKYHKYPEGEIYIN